MKFYRKFNKHGGKSVLPRWHVCWGMPAAGRQAQKDKLTNVSALGIVAIQNFETSEFNLPLYELRITEHLILFPNPLP